VFCDGEYSKSPATGDMARVDKDDAQAGSFLPDADRLMSAQKFRLSFEKYVRALFDRFAARNNLDFGLLVRSFKVLMDAIRKDYRLLLQVQPQMVAKDEDYLVFHTMNSTIIALVIGDALQFSEHWLTELGIAALLHEIGMLRLPPESYLGKRELTDEERKLIYIHPIIGYNFLKSLDFPPAVSRAVLEHHERENGEGYPKKKTAESIHLYSKIIAVACSYAALSAKRPYRDAMDSHAGMMELLRNEGNMYNDKVIRVLVSSLSVFPIGMYVMLSDGTKGQVVDINPRKPDYPIVRPFAPGGGRDGGQDGGQEALVVTSEDGIAIVRAFPTRRSRTRDG
jgi:HD-GYP domain-containing protein (c-di-GMP phosphodiesterase class II)